MQTQDIIEGLHNFWEYLSQSPVFRWGYVNIEKVLLCFYKKFLNFKYAPM